MTELKLTPIQKKYMKEGCPECKGKMHPVENIDGTEVYLWCNDCDVSMDSDGGYTC